MKLIYTAGIYLYTALIAIVSLFNKKARLLRQGQNSALSVLNAKIRAEYEYIWVHTASLGEFEQGRPLIEQIKKEYPDSHILLTFYSPSGYEVKKNYAVADVVSYLPLDTPYAVNKFLKTVKIQKAIFVKYEFWPNFLLALQKAQISTYIVSAIFRPDQLFFKWYGKWYLGLLKFLDHIFVQDTTSAELLAKYDVKKVTVAGDTRFDRVVEVREVAKHFPLIEKFIGDNPVIVGGSTWGKDEELLVQYIKERSDVKLILVPHEIHDEHLQSIFKLLQGDCIRYTEATEDNITNSNSLVIDTIGMLSFVYQYAKLAYIGGGFGIGIHNTLEAAVYGIPVVFGPTYQKFREARELIDLGGGFSIADYGQLKERFDTLLADDKAGKIAAKYVKNNTGATQKIIEKIFVEKNNI